MLLKYTVSNFKSIADTIEFTMIPTEDNVRHQFADTLKTKNSEFKVLRRGIFFGANASGKTSFVESIDFARDFIVEGQKSGRAIQVNQFKGHSDKDNFSVFQFVFYLNENIYEYGFSLDTGKVYEEWLMLMDNNEFVSVFERTTNESNITVINIEKPDEFEANEIPLIEILKNSIKEQQKNQLFLNKMSENAVSLAESIVEWFRNIVVIFPESSLRGLELKVAKDKDFATFLSNILYELDTGISQVKSTGKKFPLKKLLKKMDVPQEIIDDIYDKKNGVVEIEGKMFVFIENSGEPILYELKLEHMLKGSPNQFNKDEESDGTKRLLDLLPILFQLTETNKLFIIDELDRSVHTLVTKDFLKRFLVNSQNTQNQLIITAHDVNVIDLFEVSQQEIWFFNKNKDGVTSIKPLSDYKLEEGYNADLGYLAGRFGGIPTLKGGY